MARIYRASINCIDGLGNSYYNVYCRDVFHKGNSIMTIAEQIYALVKSLPQDQASEVLTFATSIHAKHLKDSQSFAEIDSMGWSELVYSLGGAWGVDFPTLEMIRAESGQDTVRESL
jgi:hypothetical protein